MKKLFRYVFQAFVLASLMGSLVMTSAQAQTTGNQAIVPRACCPFPRTACDALHRWFIRICHFVLFDVHSTASAFRCLT